MQNKVIMRRLKRLERKILHNNRAYIFFSMPSNRELANIPANTTVIIFYGEDEIQD